MKISLLLPLAGCLMAVSTKAQIAPPTTGTQNATSAVIESGADYRIWQSLNPARMATPGGGHMVEIATGMNYWDGTKWLESVASFQPTLNWEPLSPARCSTTRK